MSEMSDASIHQILDKDDWNYKDLKSFLERDDSSINELQSTASGTPLLRVLNDDKCCPSIVKLLLEHGADVNVQIRYRSSPLLISLIQNRNKAIVKLLLEAGAKINTHDGQSEYFLCNLLSECRSVDILRMVIVGAGSSLNSCCHHATGLSCFIASLSDTSYINTEVLELLLENCTRTDVDKLARDGRSVLCYALSKELEIDKVHIIKRLLGVGCSLSTCQRHNSPWFCAAHHQDYGRMSFFTRGIVQLLIDKGATADCFNEANESPLHCALQYCRYEIGAIELMLDKSPGEIKNLKCELGLNVLHAAMRNRHCKPSVVKLLVNRGVDVNEGNKFGEKPLHEVLIANPYEKFDIVKALIENGASVNTVTLSGETPLEIAVRRGYGSNIVEMFLSKGARLSQEQGWNYVTLKFFLWKCEGIRSKEETIPIQKAFLKFALLQNRFINIEALKQEVWDFEDFIGFANKCKNELQLMESASIDRIDGINTHKRSRYLVEVGTYRPIGTLYRLVSRCFQLQTTVDFELGINKQMFYQFLKLLEENDFPVYFDVLSALVDRDYMENKLKGITLYTVKSSDTCSMNTKTILNYLCVCNIAKFLPNDDLLRLIIASNGHLKIS